MYTDNTYPFLIIDNWYSPDELKKIWKELDFYHSLGRENIDRAEKTVIAKDSDGKPKGKSYRFYIDPIYSFIGRNKSNILNCREKFQKKEFHKKIEEHLKDYREFFPSTNADRTFVSYYENEDFYDEHFDSASFTMLIWLHKEPKMYQGGDFEIVNSNTIIESKNNRMILFPSYYYHKVHKLSMKDKNEENFGRYTITHFLYHTPQE
jgi:Rps23 Pro-64 3,4-dihydroxylase Tpa1-like proline 4-hydroxylase